MGENKVHSILKIIQQAINKFVELVIILIVKVAFPSSQ